jgi:hypothetical protein
MLRINSRTELSGIIFELEGSLAGPWVRELEQCWEKAQQKDQSIKVMLKAVPFVDSEGRKLLARMHASGAEFTAEGCMTRAIIEDIVGGERL